MLVTLLDQQWICAKLSRVPLAPSPLSLSKKHTKISLWSILFITF